MGQLVDDRRGALGDLAVVLVAAFVGVPVTAFVARGRGADVAFGRRVDFFSEGEDEFAVFFELRDPAVRERAAGLADVDVTGFLVDRQALARVFAELARAFAFGAEGELEFPIAVEDLDPAHVRVQRVDVARFPVDVEAVDVAPFAGRHHGAVVGVDFSEFAERHELGCAFFFGGVRRRGREGGDCEHSEHRDDRNRRIGMRAHRSRRRPRLQGEWRRLRRGRGQRMADGSIRRTLPSRGYSPVHTLLFPVFPGAAASVRPSIDFPSVQPLPASPASGSTLEDRVKDCKVSCPKA